MFATVVKEHVAGGYVDKKTTLVRGSINGMCESDVGCTLLIDS